MVRVAVIGAGQMGIKIAGEFAYHGHRVKIYDNNIPTLNKVHGILEEDRKHLCEEGLLPQKQFLGQVFCMSHLEEAVCDAELILEVVFENLQVKQDIFERISHHCRENAIIASNNLQLDINKINKRTVHREFHQDLTPEGYYEQFYYIPEVEISPARDTDSEVIEKVRRLVERMGKTLFFRSGQHPLILTEKQREERKKARQEEILMASGLGTYLERSIPALHHKGNEDVDKLHKDAAAIIPSDLDRDCAICMDHMRDCLFSPCHHIVVCYECGLMLQDRHDACPICRKAIDQTIRVYHT